MIFIQKLIFACSIILVLSASNAVGGAGPVHDPAKVVAPPASSVQPDAANIVFDQYTWDFGTITEGDVVRHSFQLHNRGNVDLLIHQIRTSCGCTAALLSKDVLTPGESATISITFDSSGRQDYQYKEVFIKSNDPETPFATIVITGTVKLPPVPRLSYESDTVDIGAVEVGDSPALSIVLKNTGSKSLSVYDIRSGSLCQAKLLKDGKIEPGESQYLEVSFSKMDERGLIEQFVAFSTNDPSAKKVTIRLIGYVCCDDLASAMMLVPTTWDFGLVNAATQDIVQKTFRIFNTGSAPLEITSVTMPRDVISSINVPVTIEPESSIEMTVQFDSITKKGTVKDNIFIYSNDPSRPTRKITVYGYVKIH